jgi:hypothetical protein
MILLHMVSTAWPPMERPHRNSRSVWAAKAVWAAMAVSLRTTPSCAMCGAWEAFLAKAQQTQPASLWAASPRPKQAQRPFIPFVVSELF